MIKKVISYLLVFILAVTCISGCMKVESSTDTNWASVTITLEPLDEVNCDFTAFIGSFDNASVTLLKEKGYSETIELPYGEHYIHDIKELNSEDVKFVFEATEFIVNESSDGQEIKIKLMPMNNDSSLDDEENSDTEEELVPNKPSIPEDTTPSIDEQDKPSTDIENSEKPTEPSDSEITIPEETTKPEETTPPVKEEKPNKVKFTEVNETVYAISSVNVRTGPSTDYEKIGGLKYRDSVTRIGIGDNGWSKIIYKDKEAYVHCDYLSTEEPPEVLSTNYPLTWSDNTAKITITKEWFENAWCYIAHLEFSDYDRFGTSCANGSYNNGYETTSHAAKRLGAIFAINGCYSSPNLGYTVVRDGVIWNGAEKNLYLPAVYNSNNGLLLNVWETGGCDITGQNVKELVDAGKFTDTFCFGPPILTNGTAHTSSDTSRAQRTFIGTNGNAGDIWLVVSDGRYNDGESAGLTYNQCARLLVEKGCTFGVPLDGGGSSTMYFNGKVLNAANGNQRAVVDFLYFK